MSVNSWLNYLFCCGDWWSRSRYQSPKSCMLGDLVVSHDFRYLTKPPLDSLYLPAVSDGGCHLCALAFGPQSTGGMAEIISAGEIESSFCDCRVHGRSRQSGYFGLAEILKSKAISFSNLFVAGRSARSVRIGARRRQSSFVCRRRWMKRCAFHGDNTRLRATCNGCRWPRRLVGWSQL